MRIIRQAHESEVIADFLRAEFHHRDYDGDRERYAPVVLAPAHPDDAVGNAVRRALLHRRRGTMWRELPADTQWHEVELEAHDLDRLRIFPRAQWCKVSQNGFGLSEVVDRIRSLPHGYHEGDLLQKLQSLRHHLLSKQHHSSVLLIGVDGQRPMTILEGNHRLTAALLISPQVALTAFRVFCGLSPRMTESCWYETNLPNLWRYLRHRVAYLRNLDADVERAVAAVAGGSPPPAGAPEPSSALGAVAGSNAGGAARSAGRQIGLSA